MNDRASFEKWGSVWESWQALRIPFHLYWLALHTPLSISYSMCIRATFLSQYFHLMYNFTKIPNHLYIDYCSALTYLLISLYYCSSFIPIVNYVTSYSKITSICMFRWLGSVLLWSWTNALSPLVAPLALWSLWEFTYDPVKRGLWLSIKLPVRSFFLGISISSIANYNKRVLRFLIDRDFFKFKSI